MFKSLIYNASINVTQNLIYWSFCWSYINV